MAHHFDWKSTILFTTLLIVMSYGLFVVNNIDEKRQILRKAVQLGSPVPQTGVSVLPDKEEEYCEVIVIFSDKVSSVKMGNISDLKINSATYTDFSVVRTDANMMILRFNKSNLRPHLNNIEITTDRPGKYMGNFNLAYPVVKDLVYCAL